MNKNVKNSHKLHVFLFMLRKHIYLELVQNKWVVIGNVKTFILNIYKFFVELE